jgi:hypothetical protein
MINTTCIVPVWEENDSASEYAPPYINVKDAEMIVGSQGALKNGGIYDGIMVTIRYHEKALHCLVSAEDLMNAVEKCRRDRPSYLQSYRVRRRPTIEEEG